MFAFIIAAIYFGAAAVVAVVLWIVKQMENLSNDVELFLIFFFSMHKQTYTSV